MIITDLFESHQTCPECGGPMFSEMLMMEKKDACYYKVKASAKVWPSAYASGRLVQCRKKGADNYGNKSEGVMEMNKSQTPPGRDGSNDSDASKKEYTAKATTPEKVAKDAEKILNKELNKKQGVAEGKADYNFDIEDLKRLEQIRDLSTLKAQALALISKPSAKPMKPEKVEWFKNALERMNSPLKVIKLMYDLLLSGEGNAVVGTKSSMNPNSYRQRFGEQGVAEGSQQVDSIVTDALKIMRGSTMDDAVQALKTVLGDREYNSRRGYYNFYVRQILDMYGQQGVAEKLGDNQPNLGSKRDAGKSVRKWRSERGLDETDVAEDLTRRGFLRGLGAAAAAVVAGNALAGSNDPNFVRKVHDQHNAMMEKNPRYAKEHDALGIYIARGIVGASAENNKRWVEKTAELLQKYGVKVNEGVAEDQLDEKSTSQAQFRTMAAAAHNPEFAKKVGIKQSVAKEFNQADKGSNYKKLPDRTTEGEIEKTKTGIVHRSSSAYGGGEAPRAPYDPGKYAKDIDHLDKDLTAKLDKSMGIKWPHGNKKSDMEEGEQQKGANYRDPPEADYGADYQDMVSRVKKLAGLGPLKTVWDPAKRVYRNVPTAVQPKK